MGQVAALCLCDLGITGLYASNPCPAIQESIGTEPPIKRPNDRWALVQNRRELAPRSKPHIIGSILLAAPLKQLANPLLPDIILLNLSVVKYRPSDVGILKGPCATAATL
jgi:hypothetical protein